MLRKILDIDNIFIVSAAVLIVLLYISLHLKFVKYDVDDAWTVSFFHNMLVRHISPDSTFEGGLANPHIFGMTQAYIYSAVFSVFGWTKGCAHLISSFFMTASAALWYFGLRKLNFDVKSSLIFALMVLLCEPFFREANIARPESLTFFFVSLSFVFFLYGNPFFSGLAAMAAFETHPMGLFSILFVSAYILSKFKNFQDKKFYHIMILFGGGLAAGIIYYLALHFNYLGEIDGAVKKTLTGKISVIIDYFFYLNPKHHFLEFLVFTACLIVFLIRKKWRDHPFVLYSFILAIAANFINPRENYHYSLYFYVPFLLIALTCLDDTKWRRAAPAALVLIVLTYYASVYYHNRSFNFNAKIEALKRAIPDDGRQITGSTDDWFAFMNRDFYPSTSTCIIHTNIREFYNIEDTEYYENSHKEFQPYRAYLDKNYTKSMVTNFTVNNERFNIYLLKRL